MAEMETLAEVVQGVMDARCLNHPAGYGGCTDCSPAAEEATDAALSWLASVLADDATVEVAARAVRADRETCFDDDCEACTRTLTVTLAALSAHLTAPARAGDTSGEEAGRG